MEITDRGYVEKLIDGMISDEQIGKVRVKMNQLVPYVKSVDDAIFGYLLGTITMGCLDHFLISHQRGPNPEEMDDLIRIEREKIPLIKSKIAQSFT